MRFFTDPTPFTHRVRFYGFPAYANLAGGKCEMQGTNIVSDWCVTHIAPHIHHLCEIIQSLVQGVDYEPRGFRIEIVKKLTQ